jgi:anti-anti-sigma factor
VRVSSEREAPLTVPSLVLAVGARSAHVQPTDFDLIGGTVGSLELHELRRFDGACILSVGGEIDETTVAAFEHGLEAGRAGSRALVVDLTGCTVSSDGMAALLGFQRRTRDQMPVTLVVRDPDLLRMLDVVGLTTKLGTYPTVNAALSSNSERARHEYRTNLGCTRRPRRLTLTTDGLAANALE